jgi:hypothetical protein
MSTKKQKLPKFPTAKDQESPNVAPSKYTSAHVATFHRTVLAILSHKKLVELRLCDIATILDFITIIADLADPAIILDERSKKEHENSNKNDSLNPLPKIKGLGVISRSEKCLGALVFWMRVTMTIQDLTMEKILEEYYTKFQYALRQLVVSDMGSVMPDTPKKTDNKNSGKP